MNKLTYTMALVVTLTSVSFINTSAQAFGLGDVSGAVGNVTGSSGSSGGSGVDINALTTKGKGLRGKFDNALNNMLLAQARTAEALDLKDQAAKAEKEASLYTGGKPLDSDQIKHSLAVDKEISKAIADKTAQQKTVGADGKTRLAAALPHYVKGITEMTGLPKEFKNYAQSVQSTLTGLTAHPTDAMKLKDGTADLVYVAQQLPDFVSLFVETSKNFTSYAQSNNVDTGNLGNLTIKITEADL